VIGLAVTERDVVRRLGAPGGAGGALYLRPALASCAAVALVWLGRPLLPGNYLAAAAVKGLATVVVFAAVLALFDREGAAASWALVRRGLRRP
jgi:hypothetical protein